MIDEVIALPELEDLVLKVKAAQRTLSLDLEPLDSALVVEVVLFIAFKSHYLVCWTKINQADGAAWHVWIFVWVVRIAHALQALHVALQGELPRFLDCLQQTPLDILCDLAKQLPSPLRSINYFSYLNQKSGIVLPLPWVWAWAGFLVYLLGNHRISAPIYMKDIPDLTQELVLLVPAPIFSSSIRNNCFDKLYIIVLVATQLRRLFSKLASRLACFIAGNECKHE